MRYAASLTLLAVLVAGILPVKGKAQAQPEDFSSTPPGPVHNLPETPLAPSAGASEQPLRLPPSFRPAWSAERSHLGDKLSYGFASLGSARVPAEAFLLTGIPNLPSAPTQPNAPANFDDATAANLYQDEMTAYGHGMDTWRRASEDIMRYHQHRLETAVATTETRLLLSNIALPIALRQEARYRPARIDATLDERMINAVESILVTHNDHGRTVPNYSKLVGTVSAGLLGKSVYANAFNAPEFNTTHFFVKYVGYSLAGDLATNAAHELLRASIEPDVELYQLHGRSTEDSYYPLSAGAKFVYWIKSTYAARNFVQACLLAGLPSIGKQPVEPTEGVIVTPQQAAIYDQEYENFGSTVQAWRRHLESNVRYHEHRLIGGFAASETQMTIQNLAVPMLFGVDPRYIPMGRSYDAGTRLGHAFKGLVEARTDSGGKTINFPVLLGTAGGALLAKEAYYPKLGTPPLETNAVLAGTIGFNLLADLLGNISSEFRRHRGY
jgi:hypothetical protein